MSTPQQPHNGFGGAPGYGAPSGPPQFGRPGGYPQQVPGGQLPPGPGPYGPQAPHPGPPQGPYGAPQQAPFGFGGPGMPPPVPPKGNAGKVWGIIGSIVGIVVIGSVISTVAFRGAGGAGGGSTGPKYKITVPQTLAGGEYKLDKDITQQADDAVPHDGANEHGIKTAGGQYTSGTKSLVMLGLYGAIDDPSQTVDHAIHGMTSDGKTEVAVAEKKFTPSGGGDPLTCGVDVRQEMGQKVTLAFCIWADSSTSGNVAQTDAADLAKDPQSVDLQAFADTTDKIRGEVKKPLG
ncbi:hypothetical protein [Streptomyces inhibens]|uniref:hypothetical protein n=1 Tax=Streptomyces inhibens TaxID=2293571 RepID=UPI001EE6E40A|nr:hypothetical protein [Streptomyces inhibens]UKY55605.1 hypothetical protein KI385_22775 [Streptomyces inhibens]